MPLRYCLLLLVAFASIAPAYAQTRDTIDVLIRRPDPHGSEDPRIIVTPGGDVEVYIRRHTPPDGATIRVFPGDRIRERFAHDGPGRRVFRFRDGDSHRVHADSLVRHFRFEADTAHVLRFRDFPLDSLRTHFFNFSDDTSRVVRFRMGEGAEREVRFFEGGDSLRTHFFRRLPRESFRIEGDSLGGEVRVFRHRVPSVSIDEDGALRLERFSPDGTRPDVRVFRFDRNAMRPGTTEDGLLVVPDGKGGTWIYVPPKEESDERQD